MILSHKYKFIFIAVPKTGTISIEEALKKSIPVKSCGYDIFKDDICPPEARRGLIRRHSTASQLREALGEIFSNYFKACFVRNPWDWVVSIYHFARRHPMIPQFLEDGSEDPWYPFVEASKKISFKDFIFSFRSKWRGYLSDISDEHGKVLVDFVGRFENIQMDFNRMCQQIGVEVGQLTHCNRSNRGPYQEYYDNETRDMIARIYSKEIKMFGYCF